MPWHWDGKVGRPGAISSHQSDGRKSPVGPQRLDGRENDQTVRRRVSSRVLPQIRSTESIRMDCHIHIYGCRRRNHRASPRCLHSLDFVEGPKKRSLKTTFVSRDFI